MWDSRLVQPTMIIADSYRLATHVVVCVHDELDMLVGQHEQHPFDDELLGLLTRNLNIYGPRGLIVIGQGKAVSEHDECIITDFLRRTGFTAYVLRGIPPGNPISILKDKAEELSGPPPAWILAIGSASVIDAAKVLSVWHANRPAVLAWHEPEALLQIPTQTHRIPVVVIPTCLGSGAEVSGLAELKFTYPTIRFPLVDPELVPRVAIIDTSLCRTVPWQIQAAAIIDAFSHLLDPLMSTCACSNAQMPQIHTSVHLAKRLVALAAMAKEGRPSSWLHELAWISHLAVTPGLGRTKDVSVAHRIEHLLSPRMGWSHGIGLARIIPAFIEVLEEMRHETWMRIAGIVVRMFDEEASPEILLRRWFEGLGITFYSPRIDTSLSDEIAKEIIHWFGANVELPGALHMGSNEVFAVVDRVLRPYEKPTQIQGGPRNYCVNEQRVFGQSVLGSWDFLILTPIPIINHNLILRLSGNTASGWFASTTCRNGQKSVLLISPPPSAALATDALDLARKAGARFDRVLFLGLAGALRIDLLPGTWIVPRTIANAISKYEKIDVNRLITNGSKEIVDRLPKWLGSGPMGTQMATCASVRTLSCETADLLDFWLRLGIEVVDLEAAAVHQWCTDFGAAFEGVFVISDHPLTGQPLWAQSSSIDDVPRSLEALADRIKYAMKGM